MMVQGRFEDESDTATDQIAERPVGELSSGTWKLMERDSMLNKMGAANKGTELEFSSIYASQNDFKTGKSCNDSSGLLNLLIYADGNFAKIDSNDDGAMSSEEVNEALENPGLKTEECKYLETLRWYQDEFEKLSLNDEFMWATKGITKADLAVFRSISSSQKNAQNMLLLLEHNMSSWDADLDGHLTKEELSGAIAEYPSTAIMEITLLTQILTRFDELQAFSNDENLTAHEGVTLEDLKAVADRFLTHDQVAFLSNVQDYLRRFC